MADRPPYLVLSRGRRIDLRGPLYYQDMLTGIAQEILVELAELEKLDLNTLSPEDFDQVVGIKQIGRAHV